MGFRRALEGVLAVENVLPLGELRAADDTRPNDLIGTNAGTAERELQQTSVQAFINSYQSGTRFNDTGPQGISGPVPGGQSLPQVAHSPVVSGGPGGIVFGGGAQAGAPGIEGGTFPTLGKWRGRRRY